MDVAIAVGGSKRTRVRVVSIALALMLAAATLLVVQQQAAGATPGAAKVAAVVGGDGATAQINITAIVCPILFAVRNALSDLPFFGFIEAILNQLLAAFGCTASG